MAWLGRLDGRILRPDRPEGETRRDIRLFDVIFARL